MPMTASRRPHGKSKQIDVHYCWIREKTQEGKIVLPGFRETVLLQMASPSRW